MDTIRIYMDYIIIRLKLISNQIFNFYVYYHVNLLVD